MCLKRSKSGKMKILIYTPAFYPSTGGLEAINMIIADQLTIKGFDVVLITPEQNHLGDDKKKFKYQIVRDVGRSSLWKWYKWCDVFVHSVLSLNGIWPLLFYPKKWVVIHHTCNYYIWDQNKTIISRLKMFASKLAVNIAVSNAVASYLDLPNVTVIKNAYNRELFTTINHCQRKGFVFVGRLVTEKGVSLLLNAYRSYCRRSESPYCLTIIGDGPEVDKLKQMANEYDVCFKGLLTGQLLVNELNKHACMIVPSVYNEAFGIVALEGLACGCFCIGTDGDGVQEAIGECGVLFKKGDADDLALKMYEFEQATFNTQEYTAKVQKHLSHFTPEYVGTQYEHFFYCLK